MFYTHCKPRTVVSRLAAFVAAGLFAFTASSAFAQTQPEALVSNRITQAVNPEVRVTLQHNVHPLAQARYDQGLAPGSMATGRIMLVLRRSDMQENALRHYLDDLQNPNSPNYRKWVTPAQFGQQYGISDTDLTTVTAWLQSQGFKIEKVPQARTSIIFSGNVAQIQQAFNTSIHKYFVNGETHYANSSDPQIPAALSPVVAGIAQLNDFRPKSYAVKGPRGHYDSGSKSIKPDLTLTFTNGLFLYVDPADAATIYDTPNKNLNPSYTGTTYDGTGVTIGIAGDSNIVMQDIINYRTGFLGETTGSVNTPNVVIDGNDPGINGDAVEALLDNQVAGGIAPGAKINFYTAADTDFQSGLFLALFRALDDNQVSILNVSFGACEAGLGYSGNAQILSLWEQAAAQGISVTVSSGDSGSAACDDNNTQSSAQNGLAVSGYASTPYNIAVGGTDFDVLSAGLPYTSFLDPSTTYVNTASSGTPPYHGTALKYIPENPWNDSANLNAALTPGTSGYSTNTPVQLPNSSGQNQTNIVGAGGGLSSAAFCPAADIVQNSDGSLSCSIPPVAYPQPAFQAGVTPYSSARALPDISFLASDGTFGATWAVCSDNVSDGDTSATYNDCENTNGTFSSTASFAGVGGTSAASPAFAGMLALVLHEERARTGNASLRLGQANNVLYNLYKSSPAIFHDVTAGNNSVVCQAGTASCGTNGFLQGYNAAAGYDAATGLGSVDVAQLISNWKNAAFTATTTSFTINGSTAAVTATHGKTLTFAATVAPGTATGDVSFINTSTVGNNNSLGFLTLSSGSASATSNGLPGGSYTAYAYYGGDVKNAASQSNGVAVNISAEASSIAFQVAFYDPTTGNPVSVNPVPYGMPMATSAQPFGSAEGQSGNTPSTTPATGTINFTDTAGALPGGSNVAIASNGIASYNNFATQNHSFAIGAHSISASYSGDASYNPSSTSTPTAFTVVQGATAESVAGSQSGATVTLQAVVATQSLGAFPTGTVTFKAGSTTVGSASSAAQTGYSSGSVASLYQVQLPAGTAGFVNGNNTITATYSGDTNYSGSSGTGTVALTGAGAPGFSITGAALTVVAGATTGNTSTITVTPVSGFTGPVGLTCAITSSPSNAASLPTCTLSPTSVTISGTAAATSTLTIATSATTTAGAYVVTITGINGSTTVTGTAALTVKASGVVGSFTMAGTAVTVTAGATTGNTSTLTITSTGGFSGTVGLTCALASSPSGAMSVPTCSITPSVAVSATAPGTATMTIASTTRTSGALSYPLKNLLEGAGGTALACVLMLTIPARRKAWRTILSLVVFAIAISAVIGCGGGGSNSGGGGGTTGTTAGMYTFTVKGTSSSAASDPTPITVNVTVN